MKIIGNTVGMGLPKPNLMQTDPTKGDYVKGKSEFLSDPRLVGPKGDPFTYEDFTPEQLKALKGEPGKTPVKGEDYFTEADKQEIAEQAAQLVDIPEGGTVTPEQIASAVEDYMAEHPNSSQNPTGTKVYVTLADDGTIVIAPDVGDGLTNGVTITASLADDGTIVIGGE